MRKNSLAAFTIIEMLVSMLIASLLLSLAWNIFFFTGNYRQQIEEKVSSVTAMKKIEYYVSNDFSEAFSVSLDDNRLTFHKGTDTLYYVLSDQWTVRNLNGVADSLRVGSQIELLRKDVYRICLPKHNYCFSLSKSVSSDESLSSDLHEN